jgi:hypothetical protein
MTWIHSASYQQYLYPLSRLKFKWNSHVPAICFEYQQQWQRKCQDDEDIAKRRAARWKSQRLQHSKHSHNPNSGLSTCTSIQKYGIRFLLYSSHQPPARVLALGNKFTHWSYHEVHVVEPDKHWGQDDQKDLPHQAINYPYPVGPCSVWMYGSSIVLHAWMSSSSLVLHVHIN